VNQSCCLQEYMNETKARIHRRPAARHARGAHVAWRLDRVLDHDKAGDLDDRRQGRRLSARIPRQTAPNSRALRLAARQGRNREPDSNRRAGDDV